MERTSDINDAASNLEIESREFTISGIRESVKLMDTSNPSGECWYCGEFIGNDRRWCDQDHASLWSRENA